MYIKNIINITYIFLGFMFSRFSFSGEKLERYRVQTYAIQPYSLKNLSIRPYHTKSLSSLDTSRKLNPWFITGFADGEGSFSVTIRDIGKKDTKKARVLYVFSIGLHKKDENILKNIQSTLGIGKIYSRGKDGTQFRVESKKELLILI